MLNYCYVVADECLCVIGDAVNPYTRRSVFGRTQRSLRFFCSKIILTQVPAKMQTIFLSGYYSACLTLGNLGLQDTPCKRCRPLRRLF